MFNKDSGTDSGVPLLDESTLLTAKSSAKTSNGRRYNLLNTGLIFLFPALGGLLFGYDIGATSAVISQLQDSEYSGVKWYQIVADNSFLQGMITSVGMLGAMLGSITCFRFADDLGRRMTILIASVFYLIGAAVEFLSGMESFDATSGIATLIFGRIIYGYACGFAMHGAPAYIGEMAPHEIRGLLVSLKEAFIVVGMVLGYSFGYAFAHTSGGWRYTYGLASIIAVVMCFGMYQLPRSSKWLSMKGKVDQAILSLRFVVPEPTEEDIEAIRETALKASDYNQNSTLTEDWKLFTSPAIYPALVAGLGLVIFQQITGQPSVLYYAVTIFNDVGLDTIASIGISVFKLIATLVATFTVDNYGRKLLLYVGCALMMVALLTLGFAFLFNYTSADDCNSNTTQDTCPSACSWDSNCVCSETDDDCTCCDAGAIDVQKGIILAALFIYIGGYQIGFGPISWLMISEIFPLEVRGKAVSMAVVTNFFFNFVMTFLFPVELDAFGPSITFFLYAVILVCAVYFIYRCIPETKGMTLEEIEAYFLRLSGIVVTDAASRKSRDFERM